MARLPVPGGDVDAWASILNEYLLIAHNADGTQRQDSVAPLSVGLGGLRTANLPTTVTKDLVLSNDGTNLVWRKDTIIDIRDYGAKGDGINDDTDAIQAAIYAAVGGGTIVLPRGTYMVRGLKIKVKGTQLSGTRGGVRIMRLSGSGTGPLIDMSGTVSMDGGHLRYCSLLNLTLSGNNLPGPLIRSYYADTCIYRDISLIDCPSVATDFVEVWDTRLYNCSWENCGTQNEPAMLMRNTTEPGTFGFGDDNTNQIHFLGCRWEGFKNGALRIDGGANGSTRLLNGIFLVSCKMETSVAAGPVLQIMTGTTIVFVTQLYIALLKRDAGFTGSIDAILDHATHIDISDVYVQWGEESGLANSTVHAVKGSPHTYRGFSIYYPTESPAIATIIVEPGVDVKVMSLWANRGKISTGDISSYILNNPDVGASIDIKNSGSFRVTSTVTSKDLVKIDNSPVRPTLQTLNGVDLAGFSGNYTGEKWRFYGDTGFVRLASGKFQIEGTKGYVGIGIAPSTSIGFLIKLAQDSDRGLTIIRQSATSTGRMLEFQDESNNVQGITFDSQGRPLSIGRVANVTGGSQVSYANVRVQARDIAGSVTAAIKPSPAAGSIAIITFSKPYASIPLSIVITDHSAVSADLYVSDRSATGFTVSTRRALQGGAQVSFDYLVMGSG